MTTWQAVRQAGAELRVEPVGTIVVLRLSTQPDIAAGAGCGIAIFVLSFLFLLAFRTKSSYVIVVVFCIIRVVGEQRCVRHGRTVHEIAHERWVYRTLITSD